jgi:hypothetical protein
MSGVCKIIVFPFYIHTCHYVIGKVTRLMMIDCIELKLLQAWYVLTLCVNSHENATSEWHLMEMSFPTLLCVFLYL